MKIPQPIPYQGSKRALAPIILKYFPQKIDRIIEPFAGSAAITVASALKSRASSFWVNDLNQPLMELLEEMVNNPEQIASNYELIWNKQLGNEKEYYREVRERFNSTYRTEDFLYVLARCVKGAVRYNSNGEFNQSPDNRRKGKLPSTMRKDIFKISHLLKGKSLFTSQDYSEIFKHATESDLVYMDPPYQGTSNKKDSRYLAGLNLNEFISNLELLNIKKVPFLISFDGKLGSKTYGDDLPKKLDLKKIMIEVGRSTTSTLLGNEEITYESLYISKSLQSKLGMELPEELKLKPKQLQLL
jgi:DNA adenine methylase